VPVNTDYKLGEYIKIGETDSCQPAQDGAAAGQRGAAAPISFPYGAYHPIHNKNGTWGTVPPGYGIQFGAPNPVGAVYSADAGGLPENLQVMRLPR